MNESPCFGKFWSANLNLTLTRRLFLVYFAPRHRLFFPPAEPGVVFGGQNENRHWVKWRFSTYYGKLAVWRDGASPRSSRPAFVMPRPRRCREIHNVIISRQVNFSRQKYFFFLPASPSFGKITKWGKYGSPRRFSPFAVLFPLFSTGFSLYIKFT